MDNRYFEKREAIEQYFIPENIIENSQNLSISPSGTFELTTKRYSTGPKTWAYSRGIVKRLSDNKVIADVKRNYGHFWHTWVSHSNGNDYLLCGEDYQGYSIINLTQETYTSYFPEAGYKGAGFCWTAVYPSPDSLILAVDGCYWACPYEIVFYDFSDPSRLPLAEIERYENVTDPVIGWKDNETFIFTTAYDIRKSDGQKYSDLSDEEQDLLDNEPSQIEELTEKFEWKRLKR